MWSLPPRVRSLSAALFLLAHGGNLRAQAPQLPQPRVELPSPQLPTVLRGKETRDSIYHVFTANRINELETRLGEERRNRDVEHAARQQAEETLRNDKRSNQRNLAIAAALVASLIGLFLYWKRTEETRSARQWGLTDPLTGAKNRRYLEQTIAADMAVCSRRHTRAASRGERAEDSDLVFLLFDLDHFKEVNDQHGHMVGDEVLKQVVKALEEVCRQSDVVCRWGGEEFLVVGRFTDRALAPAHAERIRKRIETCAIQVDGRPSLNVTCSVGYASYPFRAGEAGQESWSHTISLADQATYIAKHNGRNRTAGLIAGPKSASIGNAAVTPDMVKHWVAQEALILEQNAGRDSKLAAK